MAREHAKPCGDPFIPYSRSLVYQFKRLKRKGEHRFRGRLPNVINDGDPSIFVSFFPSSRLISRAVAVLGEELATPKPLHRPPGPLCLFSGFRQVISASLRVPD